MRGIGSAGKVDDPAKLAYAHYLDLSVGGPRASGVEIIADEGTVASIDQMTSKVTLNLECQGGRVFVSSSGAERLDDCTIELKCIWSPGLAAMFDDSIRFGIDLDVIDHEGEDVTGWCLSEFPIMLTVYAATQEWITASAEKNDGKPVLVD